MPSLRTLRHAFALALMALLSRAMVPAGYMPAAASGGGITFAMCSDGRAAIGWIGADGKIHKQGDDSGSDGEKNCAFSGAAAATLAALHPTLDAPTALVSPATASLTASSPGRGLAAPPPPATGPPALI